VDDFISCNTAMPKPPILPNINGIIFLSTVQDVYAKGKRMSNCLAHHNVSGARRNGFLFHIDYKGKMATVEVSLEGYVKQSRGPRNSINTAADWGAKMLEEWGKEFQQPGCL